MKAYLLGKKPDISERGCPLRSLYLGIFPRMDKSGSVAERCCAAYALAAGIGFRALLGLAWAATYVWYAISGR